MQEAIEYEDVVFTSNIYTKGPKTLKTEYSGPLDDDNDAAWKGLTRGKTLVMLDRVGIREEYIPRIPILT